MKKLITVLLSGLFILILSLPFSGCSDDEYEESVIDTEIASSLELEEYIVAAADFAKSMATFRSRMNRVDFPKLKATQDEEGNKIVQLPEMITALNMDEKLELFNQKKEAVQKAYPKILTMSSQTRRAHMKKCIQNSQNVNTGLLALGIKVRPLLKNDIYEDYGYATDGMWGTLCGWVDDPNYAEIFIFECPSGWMTVLAEGSTRDSTRLKYFRDNSTGLIYLDRALTIGPIQKHGHTHTDNFTPSGDDLATKNDLSPGIPYFFIFFQSGIHEY
jgi:hypothetical protein